MTRALTIARVCVYAACAIAAGFAPNVGATAALLAPTHASASFAAMVDPGARSIGWLGRLVAELFAHAGFAGLACATALVMTTTFALVEIRARRNASPLFALAAAALCAACSLDALHVGNGASNGLFLAALLLALESDGRPSLVATGALTVVWANSSPAGMLAPIFALSYAIGEYARFRSSTHAAVGDARPDARALSHAGALALVALAATCATPALLAYPLDAWNALSLDGGLNDLIPTVPNLAAPLGYRLGLVLAIVVAFAIGARSGRIGATCAFVVAAMLSFDKGAFVPFVAIAGAPIMAEAATTFFTRVRVDREASNRWMVEFGVVCLAAAIASGAVARVRVPSLAAALDVAPFGALAKYASDTTTHGTIVCTRLAWCDVAERRYGLAVLADSRVGNAPSATIDDQRAISGALPGWVARARARDVDAVFLDARSGLVTVLTARGWRAFATDGTGVLVRRVGATP